MNKKIKKILEEINLGKRKSIYDVYDYITLEDFLSKDENGITFLEHLIKNNIFVNMEKLKKSLEVAYIYLNNKKSLYFFELEEEDLFKDVNGKRFIDYIYKKLSLTEKIISSIKNHTEIIDMLIEEPIYSYYLKFLNKEVVSKLMIPDENGIMPILKYIDNEDVFKILINKIDNAKELIELLKKQNKYELLEYANEIALMYKVNEEYTLLEDIYINDAIIPQVLTNIPANVDFVNLIRKNNLWIYLKDASEEVLLLEIENNKTLLEELIELIPIFEISKIVEIENIETLQILKNLNKLNLATNIDEYLLLTPINEIFKEKFLKKKTLLEYLLDKGCNPLSNKNDIVSTKILQILCKRNRYDILEKINNEDTLLKEIEPGIFLIDKMLENNANINFDEFDSALIASKLYRYKRFDLLAKGNICLLLENEIYFNCILDQIKNKKIKFDLNDYSIGLEDIDTIVKFYILIAKQNMMPYIEPLTKGELLKTKEEKNLLDCFLEMDSNLTLNKILPPDVKSDLEIVAILASKGYKTDNVDIPLKENNFIDEDIESNRRKQGIGPLYPEGMYLLEKLETLFNNDGKSDKELIRALISAYRDALIINYDMSIQELRNLVETKEKNINKFIYLKSDEKSYFGTNSGRVFCNKSITSTILHETGHALHLYLASNKQPKELFEAIERLKENPETIKKIQNFSFMYYRIKNNVIERVEKDFDEFLTAYFTKEKMSEIEEFLDNIKKDKYEEFKNLGIPLNILNNVLNATLTKEEYVEHAKSTFLSEKLSVYLENEYSPILSISDILDAIYNGEMHSGTLKNQHGEIIKPATGHGIAYYYNGKNCFAEMMADFSVIIKSRNSKEYIDLLKSIIGEELFNLIANFYYENIIESKEIQDYNINILGGKNE